MTIWRGLALLLALTLVSAGTLRVYATNPMDLPPDKGGEGGAPASSSSDPAPTYSGGDSSQNDETEEYTPPPEPPKVENNAGEMGTNIGEVKNNKGTVKNNQGTILGNSGDVTQNTGTIEDNDGTVTGNFGKVTNNTGTITENFGTIANNTGTVEHHYFNMNTAMSPGNYIISYGDGFRMEQDADGVPRIYLRAGARPVNENGEQQDAIIRITVPGGREVETVILRINGQDVALIPLGNGRYRIPELPMPEGPDGFAMNEGAVIVLTKEKEGDVSGEEAQEIETLWTNFVNAYDSAPPSFNELANLDKDGVIRIEGISLSGKNRTQILGELSERTDVQMALARAYALKGSDPDEMVTFVTEDGVRVTTTLRELKELMTPLLPYRETMIYKEENPEGERTEEEMLEEIIKIIGDTTEEFYILDYKREGTGLELTIVFMGEEKKVYFEEANRENETINTMTEAQYIIYQLTQQYLAELNMPSDLLKDVPEFYHGKVIGYIMSGTLNDPEKKKDLEEVMGKDKTDQLIWNVQQTQMANAQNKLAEQGMPADWLDAVPEEQRELTLLQIAKMSDKQVEALVTGYKTLTQESQNRLKQMYLPTDLLKKLPVNAHKDVLDAIQTGTVDFYTSRNLLESYLGKEGANQLIAQIKQEQKANSQKKLTALGMPTNWLNGYSEEMRELMMTRVATLSDAEIQQMVADVKTMQKKSQEYLAQLKMPADLLKDVPLEKHAGILACIQIGTLDSAKNRAELVTLIGKDKADQLIRNVKQAKETNVQNKMSEQGLPANMLERHQESQREKALERYMKMTDADIQALAASYRNAETMLKQIKLPMEVLKDVPVEYCELVAGLILEGTLEKHKMILESSLGADGYKTLVNDVEAAMVAAQPAELPQDLANRIPQDLREYYKNMYQTGTVQQRQRILTLVGYYL